MKKILKRAAAAVLMIVVSAIVAVTVINAFVCLRASRDIIDTDGLEGKKFDFILVLGCAINTDGTPNGMLADRMKTAIAIYERYGGKLLLSGDNTSPYYDEPGAMRRMALEYGVPAENIVTDPLGVSTAESVCRAAEEFGAKSVVIVTQRYHLYRAVYVAQAAGLEVAGVKADGDSFKAGFYRLAREVAARTEYFFPSLRRAGK